MPVYVYNYRDKRGQIDTTSRSTNWSKGLSPFYLGPCDLYRNFTAKNVENAWQFSKVYPEFVDDNDNPSVDYFLWARKGWGSDKAFRYPMGKGVKPLYSFWDGEKYDYATARKKIYIPLYAKAVLRSDAFRTLKQIYEKEGEVHLRDFDGYDYISQGKTLREVINDPVNKMGHAFVLALLLTPKEDWDKKLDLGSQSTGQ